MNSAIGTNERLLAALRAVDTLKINQAEAAALLNTKSTDAQTERLLREMLATSGEPVDDNIIAQAVAMSRTPGELPFQPMPKGFGRSLVGLYINRERWIGKALMGICAAFLGCTLWWTGSTVMQARFENHAQDAFSVLQTLGRQIQKADADVASLANTPRLQGVAEAALAKALDTQTRTNDLLHGQVPETDEQLRQTLAANKQISQALATFNQAESDARLLDTLKQQMIGFQARENTKEHAWPELLAAMNQRKEAFAQAVEIEDAAAAKAAMTTLGDLAKAEAMRATLLAAAADLPASVQEKGRALVASGETALLNGHPDKAAADIASLRDLKAVLASSYRMLIVNEQGVKSGVWRYPNDNPGARNYYIVVDALDARGQKVTVPIRNEETGNTENVSRFAVRVPESFYEQVKDDKLDNGLIDKDLVGEKSAGEMAAKFSIPVAGGFITSW